MVCVLNYTTHTMLIRTQQTFPLQLLILCGVTVVVAASSILYELLLGQTLSAFFGNTIREYSITIGLYMASMGLGAFLAEGRFTREPLHTLLWVEIALATIGGSTIMLAHFLNVLITAPLLFAFTLYGIIVLIGVLTGMEIPLLFKLSALFRDSFENTILGVDYVGAFLGSLLFAFFFFPIVGLTATAFIVALGNSVAGLALYSLRSHTPRETLLYGQLAVLAIITLVMVVLLENAVGVQEYLITLYTS